MLVFCFIRLDYYHIEACWFSNGRQKGGKARWKGRCKGAERSKGTRNCNQCIQREEKNLISIKGKDIHKCILKN